MEDDISKWLLSLLNEDIRKKLINLFTGLQIIADYKKDSCPHLVSDDQHIQQLKYIAKRTLQDVLSLKNGD